MLEVGGWNVDTTSLHSVEVKLAPNFFGWEKDEDRECVIDKRR